MDFGGRIGTLENRFSAADNDIRELQTTILTLDLKLDYLSLLLQRKFSTKKHTLKKETGAVSAVVTGDFSGLRNLSLVMDDEPTICNIPITDVQMQTPTGTERTGSKIGNKNLNHLLLSPELPIPKLNYEGLNVDVENNSETRHSAKSIKTIEISTAKTQGLSISQSKELNRVVIKSSVSHTSSEEKLKSAVLSEFGFRSRMTEDKEDNRLKYLMTGRKSKPIPRVFDPEIPHLPKKDKKPEMRLPRNQGQIGLIKGNTKKERRKVVRNDVMLYAHQDIQMDSLLMEERKANIEENLIFGAHGGMERWVLMGDGKVYPMVLSKHGWQLLCECGHCYKQKTEKGLKMGKRDNVNTNQNADNTENGIRDVDDTSGVGWDADVDDMMIVTKKGELIESNKSRSNNLFSVEEKNKRNAGLLKLMNRNSASNIL